MCSPITFRWPPVALATVCLLIVSPSVHGTDDDEIVIGAAAPAANAPEIEDFEANFAQWVFPGCPNAEIGRQRIETQIKLQFAEIERCCQLTGEQRERLALAARGDLRRFLEQVEALRRKFEPLKNDEQKMNQIWQELQPLQVRQARGLTGPDALLTKILPRTMSEEQSKQFDAAQSERRRFRYAASVAVALQTLEGSVALTSDQRQKLTRLLLDLPPPRTFGTHDSFLVNYRLSTLRPAAELQQLFDARQWQALQQPFAQAKNTCQHLVQQGFLSTEDLDPRKPEARP